EVIRLEKGGTVVGALESLTYEEGSVMLQPGDRVLIYTDGASELENPGGEMFGDDRLCALAKSARAGESSQAIVEHLFAKLLEFHDGDEAKDDMVLMILQVPMS